MGLKLQTTNYKVNTRPDDRGRITLGLELTRGVSGYSVFVDAESGDITLRPFREIPAQEAWLFENEHAKAMVAAGIEAARTGNFSDFEFKKDSWINEVADDDE